MTTAPDWTDYSVAQWRSARSRELDKYGGEVSTQGLGNLDYPIRCTILLTTPPSVLWGMVFAAVGFERPPVKRGDSINAKLEYLQVNRGSTESHKSLPPQRSARPAILQPLHACMHPACP